MLEHQIFPGLLTELPDPRTLLLRYHIPATGIDIRHRQVIGIGGQFSTLVDKGGTSAGSGELAVGVVGVLRGDVVAVGPKLLELVGSWAGELFQVVE
jgi:hypothetical protein